MIHCHLDYHNDETHNTDICISQSSIYVDCFMWTITYTTCIYMSCLYIVMLDLCRRLYNKFSVVYTICTASLRTWLQVRKLWIAA
jgi:hypothetical protein